MKKTILFFAALWLMTNAVFAQPKSAGKAQMKTVRLHLDGFSKSKSGAVWMAWPETVKQALEELAAVKQIKMLLDRDEFLVTYDATKADTKLLLRTVKASGYTAQLVTGDTATAAAVTQVLPTGFAELDEALAKAKAENKPIVLDLFAEWCAPCRQLERVTFPAPAVKALLERTIFLRIDTDKFPELAQRLDVEGLPDIRLALPDGTIVRQLRSFQTAESFTTELEKLLRQTANR